MNCMFLILFSLDHIAVHLFINKIVPALTLHLPANWVSKPSPCFEDVKSSSNPGRTSNSCHKLFSKAIGRNSLAEIQQAISAGATVKIHDGFYARNKYVAMSDKLIAFTWGEDREKPTSGGTLHTWKHCKGDCKHIPYSTLASNADHDGTDPSIISSSNYVNPHKHTPASEHGYVTGKRKNSPHHIIGTNSEYNIEKKKQTTFKKGKQLSKTLSLEKVKIKNTVGGSCIVNEEDILQQFDGYDIFCSDNDNSYNDDSSI